MSPRKLLILGASAAEIFIVERARKMGVYTIVSDHYTDRTLSPAKNFADEAWDISWTDFDALSAKCRERGVNGVLAGFSEFRVHSMIKLCGILGLPAYITEEQLFKTADKTEFKKCCQKYGVPVVPAFAPDDPEMIFPVIVKPADRGGSIGIAVAHNREEYENAKTHALELSPCGNVVVEKYMGDCTKFDVYYVVRAGVPELVASNDTVMCPRAKGQEILQAAWTFPSASESVYREKIDVSVRKMLRGLGIIDGYITISGFVDANREMYIFETGFRLSGDFSFKYTERVFGRNYIDMLIGHALRGNATNIPRELGNTATAHAMIAVNYFAKDGRAKNVKIDEKLKNSENAELILCEFGSKYDSHGGLLKKSAMLFCHGKTMPEAAKTYEEFFDAYDLTDENGASLVYYRPTFKNDFEK